jgi:hypothetical protein
MYLKIRDVENKKLNFCGPKREKYHYFKQVNRFLFSPNLGIFRIVNVPYNIKKRPDKMVLEKIVLTKPFFAM